MPYALKFISGKYQGGEFPLQPNKEIVIGRSSDLDMVLVEDMVSRKHAKIVITDDQVTIQDLGSTNGTFVNGEKIKKARLKEGDRILVGTSILKLVSVSDSGGRDKPVDPAEIRSMMEKASWNRATSPMSGRIDEVPLPDLLQLFSTSKKNGVMVIKNGEHEGKIYLRNGKIYYASIDDDHELGPQKAFSRLISWKDGFFELHASSNEKFVIELDETTEGLLMDAMRELDEFGRIADQCPNSSDQLALPIPLNAPVRELSADQLDALQLVYNHSVVQAVLNKSILSDLETYRILIFLIEKGYVKKVR